MLVKYPLIRPLSISGKAIRAVILVSYLVLLWSIVASFPVIFALMTLMLSGYLFVRVECDKSLHDAKFYLARPPSLRLLRFLKAWSIGEVAAKCALFALLTLSLFGGTNRERIGKLGYVFVLSVLVTYLVLRRVKSLAGVDILRWGYLRLSLAAGVMFSLVSSLLPGMDRGELAGKITSYTVRNGIDKLWQWLTGEIPVSIVTQPDLHAIIELTIGLLYQTNLFISHALFMVLGPIGWLISIVLSFNIIYGYIVVLYALALIKIHDFSSRRNGA